MRRCDGAWPRGLLRACGLAGAALARDDGLPEAHGVPVRRVRRGAVQGCVARTAKAGAHRNFKDNDEFIEEGKPREMVRAR